MIGKGTELLYDVFLLIGIFICTDMYTWSSEHRIFSFQIFLKQGIHKFVCLWVE